MTTFGDQVKQFGGAPVGSSSPHRYEGWWGKNVYFVDYDYGTADAKGTNMDRPQKNLRSAISSAARDDTIYVRPRDFTDAATYGEDPQIMRPDTSANFSISRDKENLSIIGTGKGLSHAAAHKCWIGNASGVTDHILTIYAPGVVVENIRAQPSTGKSIIYSKNDATEDGGNLTIINNDFHDGNTSGAIQLDACWQVAIAGNRFLNCDKGIYLTGTYSLPQIYEVWGNLFTAITTEVYADIDSLAGVKRFQAHDNYHASGQPAAGAPNKYLNFTVASTGMVSASYFGTDTTTLATAMTLNGILQAGNHCDGGLIA